jgi:hypothetical protein
VKPTLIHNAAPAVDRDAVMDQPLLRGFFDPESRVGVYLEASDAFVSLCKEDPRARRPAGEAATATGVFGLASTGLRARMTC